MQADPWMLYYFSMSDSETLLLGTIVVCVEQYYYYLMYWDALNPLRSSSHERLYKR
jgi:hypothetical protein